MYEQYKTLKKLFTLNIENDCTFFVVELNIKFNIEFNVGFNVGLNIEFNEWFNIVSHKD